MNFGSSGCARRQAAFAASTDSLARERAVATVRWCPCDQLPGAWPVHHTIYIYIYIYITPLPSNGIYAAALARQLLVTTS